MFQWEIFGIESSENRKMNFSMWCWKWLLMLSNPLMLRGSYKASYHLKRLELFSMLLKLISIWKISKGLISMCSTRVSTQIAMCNYPFIFSKQPKTRNICIMTNETGIYLCFGVFCKDVHQQHLSKRSSQRKERKGEYAF